MPGMPILSRLLLILLLAVLGAAPALAQDAQKSAQIPQTVLATPDQLSAQLDKIKATLANKTDLSDDILSDARSKVQALQQQADQLTASLSPQADALKAKLDVLGPAPEKGAPPEAPEVARSTMASPWACTARAPATTPSPVNASAWKTTRK